MFPESFELGQPYKGEVMEEVSGVLLPEDYLAFIKKHNGGEGDIGGTYLVLFPLEELQTVNDNYATAEVLEGCVIIGGDGGGELYGVTEDGRYFNVPAIMDKEDITYLGNTMEEFIRAVIALWT